jgi:serine kinase of HPr protein (carbohydrate metabolism regulator)
MTVSELAKKLNLKVFSGESGLDKEITGGYTSDLLSDVMGFAKEGCVWITLQKHRNIMAVASLKEISAIILVKGFEPEPDVTELSNSEGIPVLGSEMQAFELSGAVYNLL